MPLETSRLIFAACTIVTVFSSPPNIGRGNYVYDPNSIPQNEKILKLFVRLAAHTANRLIRLKMQSTSNPIGYDEDEIVFPITEEDREDFLPVDYVAGEIPDQRIMSVDQNSNSEAKNHPDIEITTETDDELKNDHDLEMEDNEGSSRGDFPNGNRPPADEGIEEIRDYSDQTLIPDEKTTGTEIPEVEIENRGLFNIQKNSYVTHYTDQSTNMNRADTTVNNNNAGGNLGNVIVSQEAGSKSSGKEKLLFWNKEDPGSSNNFGISEQRSSASGVNVDQQTAIGASVDSPGSLGAEKNFGVDFNRQKSETGRISAAGNSANQKLMTGKITQANFQKIQNPAESVEEQIGSTLDHDSVHSSNFGKSHSSKEVQSVANVQAGHSGTINFEAGKDFGLGLLTAKLNILHEGIKQKASFDGKLNLSAHVTAS